MVASALPSSAAWQPSLATRSAIGQTQVPALSTGTWQLTSTGGWQAVLHIAAPPTGKTIADAIWTSPVVAGRYNRPFFGSEVHVQHWGVSGTGVVESAVQHTESMRLCDATAHRCGRWGRISVGWPNDGIDLASDPTVGVTFNLHTALLECGRGHHRYYVQWRTHVTQSDIDIATVTMRVAAGRAAERDYPDARCPQRRR